MNSRQRVLAALDHREPDRVPLDFSGHRSSGIAAIAYPKLREYLGLPPKPIRVYDVIQQLAIVDEDVLERFGVDTIELGRGFALDDDSWKEWSLPDGAACLIPAWTRIEKDQGRWVIRSRTGRILAHMPPGVLYFEQVYYPFGTPPVGNFAPPGGNPLHGDDDPEAIAEALEESMWTAVACPPGPIDRAALSEGAKHLRQKSDKAIIGLFGGNLFEIGQFLYRNDQFLMLLASEPMRVHRFLDKLVEIHLSNLERFLGAVGEYIDIILFGDDLGMQTGPMLSPQMYREFFKPRHRLLWSHAKKLADVHPVREAKPKVSNGANSVKQKNETSHGVKVMLHCCGGVRELIGDLIEAGLDAINPVQISCSRMNAAELKAQFGQDLTFWGGGCDTGSVLPNSTPQQVAAHVREQVDVLHPGGGFVFQQVHNILANVPPENIVAMFDAVNNATFG